MNPTAWIILFVVGLCVGWILAEASDKLRRKPGRPTEDPANALLFAAAKELYEALEAVKEACRANPAMNHERYDALGEQVLHALAKARGEKL